MIDSCVEFIDCSSNKTSLLANSLCFCRSKRGYFGSKFSGYKSEGSSEKGDANTKLVSITEAAKINRVTRQAIYVAIKQKKLRAVKKVARWSIRLEDLEDYRNHRYSRTKSLFKGKLLFDNAKGFYSVGQAARMLKVPTQRIYYATRVGHIAADRRGASWVVHISDIDKYRREHLSGKVLKARAS